MQLVLFDYYCPVVNGQYYPMCCLWDKTVLLWDGEGWW